MGLAEGDGVPDNPAIVGVWCGQEPVSDTRVEPEEQQAEFARLVLCRQDRMLRTIWRVVRDPDLAEDALQDALATLWRKLPALARHPNPEAFVLRVSLDAACDHLRAHLRRRRRDAPLDGAEAAALSAPPAAGAGSALCREVLRAIGRLKRRQATAILLRALHDESYDTIARTLGCSEATARVHVLHARENLRQWLSHLRGVSSEEASS